MNVYVVTYPVPKGIKQLVSLQSTDVVIAVDQAADSLYEQKIPIDLVIGDFDSVKDLGKLKGLKTIKLEAEKDETDTWVAIENAYQLTPSQVYLIGGLGGARFEHSYANLMMLHTFPDLIIKTDETIIKRLEKGHHTISFDGYVSLFSLDEAIITLKHFKYPLNQYRMTRDDILGISNEVIKSPGMITIDEGSLIVMLTKRD